MRPDKEKKEGVGSTVSVVAFVHVHVGVRGALLKHSVAPLLGFLLGCDVRMLLALYRLESRNIPGTEVPGLSAPTVFA